MHVSARKPILSTAAALIPAHASLPQLREIAAGCRACELWKNATQTVFGEGKTSARLMLIGEQPGNDEDVDGRPFVGPSGRLLDSSLEAAGINRRITYVTNVVKHFKWEPRGKRRIHAKPDASEITACMPWLQAEIQAVQPEVVVCLGATAAQALFGKSFRVTRERGKILASQLAAKTLATVHPSSIWRAPDEETRRSEIEKFVADLTVAARVLEPHRNAA